MIIRSCLTCISLCVIFLTEAQTGNLDSLLRIERAGAAPAGRHMDEPTPGLLRIADSLYREGRYFEASIAYERVLFENGDRREGAMDPLQVQFLAVTGKLQCLKKQAQYDQAVTFLDAWQSYPFADSSLVEIHSQQILCTYLGGHFENVLSLVARWPYLHAGAKPAPLLVVLKILSLNELQRWKEAEDAYRSFVAEWGAPTPRPPEGGVSGGGRTLPPDLYAQLPHLKSVGKAQWLSTFIPGAGLFYAGSPGEALFSILVQAAGVYFAVLSFEQHYYISAWLVGAALFGAFHMGSVRRSEVLVQRYNRKRVLQFNEKVRQQLLGMLEKK